MPDSGGPAGRPATGSTRRTWRSSMRPNVCKIKDVPGMYSYLGGLGMLVMAVPQSFQQGVEVWGQSELVDPADVAANHAGNVLLITFVVLLFGIGIPLILIANYRQPRRDRKIFDEHAQSLRVSASQPGVAEIQVVQVYQRAQRGTKAWIVWTATGIRQDTWFQDVVPRPHNGEILHIKRWSVGWGPHNSNPEVLYLHQEHIVGGAPAGRFAAIERHRRRAAR